MRRKFSSLTKQTDPLVTFGCSWAAGVGVSADQTFGHLLSNRLNSSKFTNYGIQGSSNHRSIMQLMNYAENNKFQIANHVAIFSITTAFRSAAIDQSGNVTDLISRPDNTEILKSWLTYFSSAPQANHDLYKNIIVMQQICKHYQINDFYIKAWEAQDLDLPGIDQSKIYPNTCVELFGYKNTAEFIIESAGFEQNRYIKDRHPNKLGHELIANTLYNWIKDKIV
jgi:hypothetical protein